jgi:membrane protein YqaA with SNARE-associated domain
MPWDYVLVAAIVFAVNLLPAFGPPTSAILVAVTLNYDLAAVPLILTGAVAAAGGRYLLANGARRIRPRLSVKRLANLAAAEHYITKNRGRTGVGLALFALSPVPSGQLFTAAGLMRVPLLPLTAAFFAGRLVSYAIYVTGASAIKHSFGDELIDSLTSPIGIAAQVIALVALVAFLRLDWVHILAPGANGEAQDERRSDARGQADHSR